MGLSKKKQQKPPTTSDSEDGEDLMLGESGEFDFGDEFGEDELEEDNMLQSDSDSEEVLKAALKKEKPEKTEVAKKQVPQSESDDEKEG